MVKKYKRKTPLKTIDDFLYTIENTQNLSDTQEDKSVEHNFIVEHSENNEVDTTEHVEIPNQTYINNSPSMDDDFLGGINNTAPILKNENFTSTDITEDHSSSEKEIPKKKKELSDIKSLISKIKKQ